MSICIYITDSDWFSFLSSNNLTQDVNFWRRDNRQFNLQPGEFFYFKIREANYISGRGEFVSYQNMSVLDAWNEYNIKCGKPNYVEFQNSVRDLYPDLDINTVNIQCIKLTNIQWLKSEQFIEVTEELFSRQTQAFKIYFTPLQIETLNQTFNNRINNITTDVIVNEELDSTQQFTEGSIKLSLHKKIERNHRLIQQVKRNRRWICEICTLEFRNSYGVNYIEGHHKIPLHLSGQVVNQENDIALLCANCHKAVHKIMVRDSETNYEIIAESIRTILNG